MLLIKILLGLISFWLSLWAIVGSIVLACWIKSKFKKPPLQ